MHDLYPTEEEFISPSILPSRRVLLGTLAAVFAFLLPFLVPATAHAEELPPGGTFVDDDLSVHEGSIEAIAEEEITAGCGPEQYCPSSPVTRGQMAAFLARALQLPSGATDHFTDDDGHTFESAINALAAAGITSGCGSGSTYCPDEPVTRGQMAAFLARPGGLQETNVDYFTDDDGHAFEDAINALARDGVTAGCNPPDNTAFCPGEVTTRSQMATFITRSLGLDPIHPPEREGASMGVLDSIRAWFPNQYDKAVRVADCESSLNPRAVNWGGGWHGLFQIAEQYHRSAFERVTGQSWEDGIYVAYYNAQFASYLRAQSGSWDAWGCRHA